MSTLPLQNTSIGFIGLGVMGSRLAARAVAAGLALTVFDLVKENVDALVAAGAVPASGSAEAGSARDVVFTCVPSAVQLEDVLFGRGGLAGAMKPGSILVDLSTIGPNAAADFAARLRKIDIAFIDAAMAQGAVAAESGTLTLLLGGDREAVARVEPILEKMVGMRFHFGAAGAGQAAKLAYNVSGIGASAAAAEGVKLLLALGGDLAIFSQMLATVDANVFFRRPAQDVLSDVFAPGFRSALALKDLQLALSAAEKAGVHMVVAPATRDALAETVAAGHGELRTSAIALLKP